MASIHRDIDGGFAWFILAACIIMTCFEHIATTGIFYMAILEKYQRTHYATIWIQTLQLGAQNLTGVVAGVLIEKRGCRFTALLAGIIYTTSFLVSAFAPTLEVLYVSLGIGTGFSQNLLRATVFTILPYYFDQKLGMAIGFTQAGVGVGLLFFSVVNGYLVATYGLQGAFLILTGVAAHTIAFGIMMRKPSDVIAQHVKKMGNETNEQSVDTEKQALLTNEKELVLETKNDFKLNEFDMPVKDEAKGNSNCYSEQDIPTDRKNNIDCYDFTSLAYTIGLDLFKNKYYTMLILAASFIVLPHTMFTSIMPDHIKWTGSTEFQATSILIIIGAANTVSRLFFWKFSNDKIYRSVDILAVSSLLSGTGLVCTLFLYKYWMYIILCILYGITRGVHMIYFLLLLIQIVGKERSHQGYGLNSTLRGIIVLIATPSFGAVTDVTYHAWGYNIVFLSLGSCEIVAGFILIGLRMLYRKVVAS